MPTVLTIAGSDPTGGAGIQADERVIEAMGCCAVSVITALTSQSSQGVTSVFAVPVDVLRSQLDTILSDIRPDAAKIGLLPSAAHIRVVADAIELFRLRNIVLDPVIAPSIGAPFLDDDAVGALRSDLIPAVHLTTPNTDEAAILSSHGIHTREDMEAAGRILWELGAKNSLIKGGHLAEASGGAGSHDLFVDGLCDMVWIAGRYVDTAHRHGTGCYLSSAIAAGLASDLGIENSIRDAKQLLEDSLRRPRRVGKGRGSPGVPDVARISELNRQHSDRLSRLCGIYYVTDDRRADPAEIRSTVLAALRGGVRVVQLRDKALSTGDLTALAHQLRIDTDAFGALLIVNDYAGVAETVGADGVHLGPGDISPAQARQIVGPGKLVGISAGSRKELAEYDWGGVAAASYIGCGPVFGTSTKANAGKAIGVEALLRMRSIATRQPIIAIGGITAENLASVCETGVAGAAVVSAISQAPDPESAAADLVRNWEGRE